MNKVRIIFGAIVLVLIASLISMVSMTTANATGEDCVPQDAWTETISGTPDQWWNWSPIDTKGPQDYTPAFPSDERGTWNGPHENGGPMQDTFGTFQTGSGNSPWFHRTQGTADQVIEHEAVVCETPVEEPETPVEPTLPDCEEGTIPSAGGGCYPCENPNLEVPGTCDDAPAAPDLHCGDGYVETAGGSCYPCEDFNHDTGICNDDLGEPCYIAPGTVTWVCDGSKPPKQPSNDEPKVTTPVTDAPNKTSGTTECLAGALVTKTTDANGNKSTSFENGHPSCPQVTEDGGPIVEEGM